MRRLLLVLAASVLVVAACSGGDDDDAGGPTGVSYAGSEAAPPLDGGVDWLNGPALSLDDLRGKVVLLDFWTYGCINCLHLVPELRRLEDEFAEELVVVGVHSAKFDHEGETDNIRRVLARHDIRHPVVNDRDFRIWEAYGVRAWPTTVLIDPAGNLVLTEEGEGVEDTLRPVIGSLVEEFDARGELDRTPLDLEVDAEGAPETLLAFPGKVAVDGAGARLFISDTNHHRVIVSGTDGAVVAAFGTGRAGADDGAATEATFRSPQGLALSDDERHLFVADRGNHAVRAVDLAAGTVRTVVAADAGIRSPWDVAVDGDRLLVAASGTHQIWSVDAATGSAEVVVGSGREGTRGGAPLDAELAQPSGLALAPDGRLFVADSESSTIRVVDGPPPAGVVDTLAGSGAGLFDFGDADGRGRDVRLQHPLGVAFADGTLYVADTYNGKIRSVDPADGTTRTVSGGGDQGWRDGDAPRFREPGGIAVAGRTAWVADTNNHAIRSVDLDTGAARTLVLTGLDDVAPPGDAFEARVVRLDPVEAGAGDGSLAVRVDVPPGYKVNPLAPSRVAWSATGDVRLAGGGAEAAPGEAVSTGTAFPLTVGATFGPGGGAVTAELTLYYCEADADRLCLVDRVRLEQPVRAGQGAGRDVELTHRVARPGG